jgi:hypothetical protein
MSEQPQEWEGPALPTGRHRRHTFPARAHVLKVLYSDQERDTVALAAEAAGLRPSSYVASAALRMAQSVVDAPADGETSAALTGRPRADGPSAGQDREVLAELIQARLALRRYGVNVNQAARVLNSCGHAPGWLEQAVAGGERAVARVDAAAALLARRLA